MAILWELGGATAEQIREALPDDLHDSTVRTLLRQLEEKGLVAHEERGRVFVYSPAVERERVQATALRGFLKRFFGGSAEALVQRLLNDEHLTREQLEQIRKRDPSRRGAPVRRKGKRGSR
jgi:predicted transcriptional regulator